MRDMIGYRQEGLRRPQPAKRRQRNCMCGRDEEQSIRGRLGVAIRLVKSGRTETALARLGLLQAGELNARSHERGSVAKNRATQTWLVCGPCNALLATDTE